MRLLNELDVYQCAISMWSDSCDKLIRGFPKVETDPTCLTCVYALSPRIADRINSQCARRVDSRDECLMQSRFRTYYRGSPLAHMRA